MRTGTHISFGSIALGVLAAACFSEDASSPVGLELVCGQPPPAGVTIVETRNFAFVPDTLRVPAGARVAWLNCEPEANRNEPHTTTGNSGEWDSPLLGIGQNFVRRFTTPGEFAYHCRPHPFMRGVVIVE